jgi:apolipoprotein N-acyltransferase
VAGVAPLLLLEWIYPALFPVHVGDSLVDRTAWIQLADLGGPLLVSALVALGNAAVFETWRWLRSQRALPLRTWLAAAIAAALAWGYGTLRIEQVSRAIADAPSLRVGVVQANLGVDEKRRDPLLVHRRHLEQSRELLAGTEIDLLVWPETVYSRGLAGALPISGLGIRDDLRVPLLFGGASVRAESGNRRTYNSALLIGADGAIRDGYDKNLLVPFTEYVPLAGASERFAAIFPHAQHFGAGTDQPPLALGDFRIATPICSESVVPWYVRKMVVRGDPHLIVSLANDAWFGASQEPWIHLALARFRAVEHKRALVHATNSGVSAVVDPLGRITARAGLQTRENLVAVVPLLDGQTVYGRVGDWPGWIAAVVTAIAVLVRKRPHEPRRSASPRYAGR